MYYSIQHVTKFNYNTPVYDSVMDLRMKPRHEGPQRCHWFNLTIEPHAQITNKQDNLGNIVHHFNQPEAHRELVVTAQAIIELTPFPLLPNRLDLTAWAVLDQLATDADNQHMLAPSHFARPTQLLHNLANELYLTRSADPLTTLRNLNAKLHHTLVYVPNSTRVDSSIDEALKTRQGVCQDFAHIMIVLARRLGIPCRYVSGYLYYPHNDETTTAATHAWIEALLPNLGWIGFDPTNNLMVTDRHVRVAIGRDYADVPPTRGVFTGSAQVELNVNVQALKVERAVLENALATD